jgi:hypothetical protein
MTIYAKMLGPITKITGAIKVTEIGVTSSMHGKREDMTGSTNNSIGQCKKRILKTMGVRELIGLNWSRTEPTELSSKHGTQTRVS